MPSKPSNVLRKKPSDLGREGCAVALRKALAGAPQFRSARELAAAARPRRAIWRCWSHKELILHDFSGVQQTVLLERMVEVVNALQARL